MGEKNEKKKKKKKLRVLINIVVHTEYSSNAQAHQFFTHV